MCTAASRPGTTGVNSVEDTDLPSLTLVSYNFMCTAFVKDKFTRRWPMALVIMMWMMMDLWHTALLHRQQAPGHQNTLALQTHLSPRLSAVSAPGHLSLSMKGRRDLCGSDHIKCAKDLKMVHKIDEMFKREARR